jgi:hypothetical protein
MSGWGGKRPGTGGKRERAGKIPLPIVAPGRVTICVANARAIITRWRAEGNNIVGDQAKNWQELEEEAIKEIDRQKGSITLSAQYGCPKWLRKKATFPPAVQES